MWLLDRVFGECDLVEGFYYIYTTIKVLNKFLTTKT